MKQWLTVLFVAIGLVVLAQPASTHLKVGDKAPPVYGTDQHGRGVNTNNLLLGHNYVAIIFYRGVWCPVCRRHVSALQDSLQLLVENNVAVVLVTPEQPESVAKMADKTDATFPLIHDVGYQIMSNYGVNYTVSKETVSSWYKATNKRSTRANGNEDGQLPVPATFLINKEGIIQYIHYDVDYHNRAGVKDILDQL